MEQFVLGIFQEQLSKFIVGFRKEQVNANLLNGKGEIRDVELNCSFLNEMSSKLSPLVEFESVHVSKVSFYVSSWTNIRKAPILIDIEHVTANLVEPLHFLDPEQGRKEIQQITRQQLVNFIQQGIIKQRGAYNLFDRILDNLTVEVSSVHVQFQPYGKFKTRRPGPWTPPALLLTLANIRFVSVNEYGQEAPPEEVWRHNHHANSRHKGTLIIYKKCEMEYKVAIQPNQQDQQNNDHPLPPISLVTGQDNKVELQLAIQRRIRDGEVMAVQVDATIPSVQVNLPQEAVPHVAHALAGVAYLLAKDRAFVDPLVSKTEQPHQTHEGPIVTTTLTDGSNEEVEAEHTTIEVNIEEQDSSSDEEEEGTSDVKEQDNNTTTPGNDKTPSASTATAPSPRYALPDSIRDEPVIVLPNGICIHERISVSVSILNVIVRGTYGSTPQNSTPSTTINATTSGSMATNCFELISKGVIAEAIWPKTTKEKGGYVQASVSYFTMEEKYEQQIKTLMSGGVQFYSKNPVESPSKPLSEVGRDETFPLYEERSLRPDPMGLRYTFPAQAFGLKTTVDFLRPKPGETEEPIQVLHEIGVDRVDFAVESSAWGRILGFIVNEEGGGFDPKWHSGNWSSVLTPNMLVSPSSPLDLDECLQKSKQIFLDENDFISSDLFNVTARLTRVETRIPACIPQDVKSCDIVMILDEAMLLVSSALPRTMLSGRIGASVNGDASTKKGVIEYPNDVSDVAYELERLEDPSNRQRGMETSRAISTCRMQLTLRGCSVELRPAIDFYTGHRQPFLAPCELTMICCFEGEPPQAPDDNLTKSVLFLSMLIHRYEVNLDLDLLAASLSTLMYHGDYLQKRGEVLADVIQRSTEDPAEVLETEDATETSESPSTGQRIPKSLAGQRVLIQKQLRNSRESGGISIAIGIQIAQLRARLWRQHVVVPTEADHTEYSFSRQNIILPAVTLIDSSMEDMEMGFEATLKGSDRRSILKGCISTVEINACDFDKLQNMQSSAQVDENGRPFLDLVPSDYLVELLSLGSEETNRKEDAANIDYAFGFRLEEVLEGSRRWSISSDLANGGIFHLRPEAIETLAVQIFEALLMPYDKHPAEFMKSGSTTFPEGTVGAILQLITPSGEAFGIESSEVKDAFFSSDKMAPGEHVDALLQMVLERYVPENVDMVLFRSRIEDLSISMPSKEQASFSFNLHYADFLVAYFLDKKPTDAALLQTLARKDESWLSLVQGYEKGLFHRLNSRQSLSNQEGEGDPELRYVVPRFNFAYSYAQSRAKLGMDEGLEIGVDQFDDFVACVRDFAFRFQQMCENMKGIIASVHAKEAVVEDEEEDEISTEQKNPAEIACGKAITSVRDARIAMNEIHSQLRNLHSVDLLFENMQNYLDLLRYEAFRKEKDRLAALAVVESQATGWLRMGSPGRSGQRGTLTATLWPYWVVLRKGMMLVYNSPSKTRVLEIICLQGAALYQLSGGQRKRDLKRAFGIVQRSGLLHLVTIETDREYHDWVREMKRSIVAYGDFRVAESDNADNQMTAIHSLPSGLNVPFDAQQSDSFADDTTQINGPDDSQATSQGRFGRGLSRAVNVAKATKRVVTDRSTRKKDGIEIDDDQSVTSDTQKFDDTGASVTASDHSETGDDLSQSPRRAQVRNRLAGVGQATKSRFGSAMQKAREKGRAIAEKRQQQKSAVHSEASNSTNPSEWQCQSCTFLNNASAEKCEMCSGSRPDENLPRSRAVSSGNASDVGSENADDHASSRSGNALEKSSEDGEVLDENATKPGMRGRLGAAVRSVARGGGTGGAARKLPSSGEPSSPGAPSSLKMREVSLAEPLENTSDPFAEDHDFEATLKRLEGHWCVRVAIVNRSAEVEVELPDASETSHVDSNKQPEGQNNEYIQAQSGTENTENDDRIEVLDGHEKKKIGRKEMCVEVYQEKGGSLSEEPYSRVYRAFSDIYVLHTSISECLGRLPPAASYAKTIDPRDDKGTLGKSLAKILGLTALEAVRTSAKLLAGLLEDGILSEGELSVDLSQYHAEVVCEFLNSMIDVDLPIDALMALSDFLELTEVSTRLLLEERDVALPRQDYRSKMEKEFVSVQATLNDAHKLAEVCQADMVRAESNSVMAKMVTKMTPHHATVSRVSAPVTSILNIPAPVLSSRLHHAVHDALMKVMAERDSSRARYVAADILHVHELEQERKRNKRLTEELASFRPPLKDEEAKELAKKKKQEASNDEELMSLCQQLSSEISARTEAELEINRLKEIRETERSNEAMEKEALQEEIQQLKDELDAERNATESALRSSSTWQRSFEDALDFRKDTADYDRATM